MLLEVNSTSIKALTRSLAAITFTVNSSTSIVKNGATTSLNKLTAGDHLMIQFEDTSSSLFAVKVRAETPGQRVIFGRVAAKDDQSLTVERRGFSTAFKIDSDQASPTFTVIMKGGELATLDQFATGMKVFVGFIVKVEGSKTVLLTTRITGIGS